MPKAISNTAATGAASQALAWIERHIQTHQLRLGDPLPGELEIARAAGVGRSSVREALTALKVLGIIRSRRRGGIRIIRDPVLLELRHYFAERHDTAERFADAQEFRAALEWGFGPLALARIAPATIRDLRAVVRAVAAAGPGKADIEAAEVRFHTVLTAGAGNRLAALFAHLYVPLFRVDAAAAYGQTQAEIDEWTTEHGELVEALAARDVARFRAVLKAHTHGYMRWPNGRAPGK